MSPVERGRLERGRLLYMGHVACIVFLWVQGRRWLYVEHVSFIVFLWLQGGRLLYEYSVSMVTGRQVAVHV